MGNIKNYNFNKLNLKLSNSEFWDFFLSSDDSSLSPVYPVLSGECLVVQYDFNDVSIYPNSATTASTIYSLVTWDGAVNTGYTLSTIGLTGIDNGLIPYVKDPSDPKNLNLLSALTGTTLVINSGDTRLVMNEVSGSTGDFIYPIDRVVDSSGNYAQFCGGFYQGYYKIDGTTYQVLPTRVNQGWTAEFWLNPNNNCNVTGNTLNDTYPNNKGFFFYMGTRAENKFWNQFSGVDSGCTSGCTTPSGCTDTISEFCTTVKEKDITLVGPYGFGIPLNPPQIEIELITNPFLIYGRAYDSSPPKLTGSENTILVSNSNNLQTITNNIWLSSPDGLGTKTVCTYDGNGIAIAKTREILHDFQNPFLIYGRGKGITGCTCNKCCGPNDGLGDETVYSFSGRTTPQTEIDYKIDIIDNAIGFRIKDDGSIGYRMLTLTGACMSSSTSEKVYSSGFTVNEGYSISGMVSPDEWSYITIKFVTNYMDNCQLENNKGRTGKLLFYVNAKLKYVVNDIPELMARRLNEYDGKQVGVPFNFSLGGGSQGLVESQTFDGLDMEDRNLPIEKNFAGTFIGGISKFNFNICDLGYEQIVYNYETGLNRYKP